MPLDDLSNTADLTEMIIGGWRYVFSRPYRLKKHREWREQGWIGAFFEVTFGLAGNVISIGFLALALKLGWNSLQ